MILTKILIFFTLAVLPFLVESAGVDEKYKNAKDINESPRMKEILGKLFKSYENHTVANDTVGTLIVGGSDAHRGQIPFQVLIYTHVGGNSYVCGGSVISSTLVITAAHCVDSNFEYLVLYFGIVDTESGTPSWTTKVYKKDVKVHENYDPNRIQNDIALIKLTDPPSNLLDGYYVGAVTLPRGYNRYDFVGYTSRVSGFGRFSDRSRMVSTKLKYADLTVMRNSDCGRSFPGHVRDTNICQKSTDASACNGDSGGPMTVTIDGKTILVGIVSFGKEFCERGYPVVFTRVTSYLNWIEENSKTTNWVKTVAKGTIVATGLTTAGVVAGQSLASGLAAGVALGAAGPAVLALGILVFVPFALVAAAI